MAFQRDTSASAPTAPRGRATGGDFEKAIGFLNFYVPTQGGQRRKLGTIPLRESKAIEKQIADFLAADEANAEKLQTKLIIDFNPQLDEADPANALDLV